VHKEEGMTDYHYVEPYRRKDGTWVRGHTRRNPSPKNVIGGGGGVLTFFVAVLIVAAIWSLGHGSGGAPAHQDIRPTVQQTHITPSANQGGS
jgi:hypothetical protein